MHESQDEKHVLVKEIEKVMGGGDGILRRPDGYERVKIFLRGGDWRGGDHDFSISVIAAIFHFKGPSNHNTVDVVSLLSNNNHGSRTCHCCTRCHH